MFDEQREMQFRLYNEARTALINSPEILISLESFCIDYLFEFINSQKGQIKADYDEASLLYPFWQNYPPEDRGRSPKGDQFPWIEVGEHAVGDKLSRYLPNTFDVRDVGLPTGPDLRFLLNGDEITKAAKGFCSSVMLFSDIKSVGPRDDKGEAVMSHNQISGDGLWDSPESGVINSVIQATGKRATREFFCSIPPIYITSDGSVAPVINVVIKPVYKMLNANSKPQGQPLDRIVLACIPNGLLLKENPAYLTKYPSLFYPGKDDKNKNPLKVRARVSFPLLKAINPWRVQVIQF